MSVFWGKGLGFRVLDLGLEIVSSRKRKRKRREDKRREEKKRKEKRREGKRREEERRGEEKKSTKLVKKKYIDQSSRLGRPFWGFISGAFFE